ncbi:DUF6799 domain-containing protein [Hymenobacter sp. B81]|uniref:DUF6799 domain-containing protein n=1 Tax=Hymenobacter sp. B81 TaxID=3344878 RepID=UPI0037DDBE2C
MMRLILVLLAATALAGPHRARAQQLSNDGFQRRNGQMHVLRNGQLRPMTRDARLPTGAVVTKDGFVVSQQGRRTELREGQGCDLRGNVVAVVPAAGGLALAAPRPVAPARGLPVGFVLNARPGEAGFGALKRGRGAHKKKGKHKWKKGRGWDD